MNKLLPQNKPSFSLITAKLKCKTGCCIMVGAWLRHGDAFDNGVDLSMNKLLPQHQLTNHGVWAL
jgi:hypothetical protein